MVTSQKAVLSLLISVLLFAAFSAIAFTGLFDLLEASFYNPSIIANITRDNESNAEVIDRFLVEMQSRFSETLKTNSVKRSFLSSQNPEDVLDRSRIYNLLINSFTGIQVVRFIDSGGRRLLFSTDNNDLLNENESFPVYANYDESDIPYETIKVDDGGTPTFTFDSKSERILFSFPLYDSFDIYWGTALFSISMEAVLHRLVTDRRIRFTQDIMVISNPSGLVFGMSSDGERALPSQISSIWRVEGQKSTKLVSPSSGLSLILISTKTSQGFYVGRLVNEEQFSFTSIMKITLLVTFFLTMYLIIFLLFSLKQDPVAIIQNRLKQLQVSLFEQFFELKGEADWTHWIRELEYRKGEIKVQLKAGLKAIPSGDIDVLINKSWDELLSVMGSRRDTGIDEEKLKAILNSIMEALPGSSTGQPSIAAASLARGRQGLLMKASALVQKIEDAELVEEVEEIEEIEEIDEIEELQGLDVTDKTAASTKEASGNQVSSDDIAFLASQIEFSQVEEPDVPDEETIEQYLEIVSPFSTMLYNLSSSDSDEEGLIIDEVEGETLTQDVIEERGGVHFISEDVLSPGQEDETAVDRDFKDLVDSVIK